VAPILALLPIGSGFFDFQPMADIEKSIQTSSQKFPENSPPLKKITKIFPP
jgi:hypothetical protein